jgi:hypothetical protein
MADPAFPAIDRDLALQLDALQPPALSRDFAAQLATLAQATPQAPAFAPWRPARWRAVGRRARFGIAIGSLALVGLGSVSAAAAGYLGEPVNRAVHRLPVVGKLIEKVIPEKRRVCREWPVHRRKSRRQPGRGRCSIRSRANNAGSNADARESRRGGWELTHRRRASADDS